MDTFPIVAVAADAGDLDAASELLFALPAEFGAAIIVVQHFDAGRAKSLAAMIARQSSLPVTPAQDDAEPERNHVYLLPANATLTLPGGRIRVEKKAGSLDFPGDVLFTSLAQERGAGAVGVVLSGTGSDGALGARAIKKSGGITFAQHPGSARFPSMPLSAIDSGCVDFVLRPYEIARELVRLGRPSDVSERSAGRLFVIDDKVGKPILVSAPADSGHVIP
jgi:two-component system CheB/CheR fusion protein